MCGKLLKTFPYSTCLSLQKRNKLKTSYTHLVLKTCCRPDETLVRGRVYNILSRFKCLRRGGIPKTTTPLLGVQTVIKTASKHYTSAVNSFKKRDRDVFIHDVSITPKMLQIEEVKHICIKFLNVLKTQ